MTKLEMKKENKTTNHKSIRVGFVFIDNKKKLKLNMFCNENTIEVNKKCEFSKKKK